MSYYYKSKHGNLIWEIDESFMNYKVLKGYVNRNNIEYGVDHEWHPLLKDRVENKKTMDGHIRLTEEQVFVELI